jgi:aromatic ring-opening dioxygenase catalytic subunit (LigB family)
MKKKYDDIIRLGKFLTEKPEYESLIMGAMVSSMHSDFVHLEWLDEEVKRNRFEFKKFLKQLHEDIYNYFGDPMEEANYYRLMYALGRIKRKYKIHFDKE